jgi:hypothetical protein
MTITFVTHDVDSRFIKYFRGLIKNVEDNIKLDIEKAVCKKADQMHLAQDKAQW